MNLYDETNTTPPGTPILEVANNPTVETPRNEPATGAEVVAAAVAAVEPAAPAKRPRGRPRKDGRPAGSVTAGDLGSSAPNGAPLSALLIDPTPPPPDPAAFRTFEELGELAVDAARDFMAGKVEAGAKLAGLDDAQTAGLVARLEPGGKREIIAANLARVLAKYDLLTKAGPETALIGAAIMYGLQCKLILDELQKLRAEVAGK